MTRLGRAPDGAPSLEVAGWSLTLLELEALHAPLRWIDPHAAEDELGWLPCHVLLCRRGGETLLVDCGLGVFHDAFDLPVRRIGLGEGLAAAGCPSGCVTTVVLTHSDPDHAGGIVIGTFPDALEPALPGARVVVLDLLLDAPAEHAERVVAALRRAGVRVEGVADGGEVVAGVRLRSAPGHRGGHACLELSAGRERFVFLADAIHAREHVARPEWDHLHDSEPAVALATRRALIDELAGSGTIVACSHVDSFGRIERDPGGGAVWLDVALKR